MSRTRIVFLIMLAAVLGFIAIALAIELFSEQTARQLFIAATVFSAGVVLLDLTGILGGHHGDSGHDFDASAALDHADAGGHDGFDHGGHSQDTTASQTDHGSDAHGHTPTTGQAAIPILSALTYLRLLVYFCLGFGPTGWASMISGRSALTSLALATPVGLAALAAAQAFFRFQRRDTDSQVRRDDLLHGEATVIVSLDYYTMGKVRVRIGMNVTDLFALASDLDLQFKKGDVVRIVEVTDECVYVQ